jgi:hypothetical protein
MKAVARTLKNARQILNADGGHAHGRSRGACLIARQALERAVEKYIEAAYGKIDHPSFTTQLIVIEQMSLDDPVRHALARRMAWTWSALSSACHAHGYPLEPTHEEVERWIETIEDFSRSTQMA